MGSRQRDLSLELLGLITPAARADLTTPEGNREAKRLAREIVQAGRALESLARQTTVSEIDRRKDYGKRK